LTPVILKITPIINPNLSIYRFRSRSPRMIHQGHLVRFWKESMTQNQSSVPNI